MDIRLVSVTRLTPHWAPLKLAFEARPHLRGSSVADQTLVAVLLAIAVIVTGCRATGGTVQVDVRNVSPGAVTLVTEDPGPFLFSNTYTHVVEPWQEGRCFAHLGLYNGHIKVTVSGSNIAVPVTYETTTQNTPMEIGVQIDADGKVRFGGTFPEDKLPCEGGGY